MVIRPRKNTRFHLSSTAVDRVQLTVVAKNRKTIGALLNQIVDEAEKLRFGGRSPKV